MPYKDSAKQREYQRQSVAERRRNYFANKFCLNCGSIMKLELHHVDPSTKIDHRIWSWSDERIEKETSKCEVLCQDCHKIETRKQTVILDHGRRNTYMNHGCRCSLCVDAAKDHRNKQRLLGGRKHQASYACVA